MADAICEVSAQYLVGIQSTQPIQIAPNGYKKTEIGMLPKDWSVVSISEIASTGGGTTPPRSLQARYFTGGRHLWVKTTDLNNSFVIDTEDKVTDLALQETGLRKHPVGTVLVAMYGGFNQIGRTGVLSESSAINQALIGILPNKNKFNSSYLLAILNYNVEYWKQVASSSRKDPNITSSDVKAFKLPLPSLEEQSAIANALSDVYALINSLENLIDKKQAIKSGTMQQLLTGRIRLPGFAGEWVSRSLESISSFITKGSTPTTYGFGWVTQGVLFLRSECVSESGLDLSQSMYISEMAHASLRRSEVRSDDLLMTITGNVGRVVLLDKRLDGANINQHIARVRISCEKTDSRFVFHYLSRRDVREDLEKITTGQAYPQLSLKQVRECVIELPPLAEQVAIATILSDMDTELGMLKERLDKVRQLKQGMMQELLTGRTRLV